MRQLDPGKQINIFKSDLYAQTGLYKSTRMQLCLLSLGFTSFTDCLSCKNLLCRHNCSKRTVVDDARFSFKGIFSQYLHKLYQAKSMHSILVNNFKLHFFLLNRLAKAPISVLLFKVFSYTGIFVKSAKLERSYLDSFRVIHSPTSNQAKRTFLEKS